MQECKEPSTVAEREKSGDQRSTLPRFFLHLLHFNWSILWIGSAFLGYQNFSLSHLHRYTSHHTTITRIFRESKPFLSQHIKYTYVQLHCQANMIDKSVLSPHIPHSWMVGIETTCVPSAHFYHNFKPTANVRRPLSGGSKVREFSLSHPATHICTAYLLFLYLLWQIVLVKL